jgi:hypothetical protein
MMIMDGPRGKQNGCVWARLLFEGLAMALFWLGCWLPVFGACTMSRSRHASWSCVRGKVVGYCGCVHQVL